MTGGPDAVVLDVVSRLDREALVEEIFHLYVDRFESFAALPTEEPSDRCSPGDSPT